MVRTTRLECGATASRKTWMKICVWSYEYVFYKRKSVCVVRDFLCLIWGRSESIVPQRQAQMPWVGSLKTEPSPFTTPFMSHSCTFFSLDVSSVCWGRAHWRCFFFPPFFFFMSMLNALALAGSLGSTLIRHEVHHSKTQLYEDKDDFHREKRTHSERLELWNNIDCNFMDTEMSWRNQDQARFVLVVL